MSRLFVPAMTEIVDDAIHRTEVTGEVGNVAEGPST